MSRMNNGSLGIVPVVGWLRGGAVLALCLAVGFAACGKAPEQAARTGTPAATPMDPIKRGEFLVGMGACSDCHTPMMMGPNGPEPDMSRYLSGHPQDMAVTEGPDLGDGPWMFAGSGTNTAWSGPWGISFTANLTPDVATGLGSWTDEMFIATLRNGKHMGTGRDLLPPMPWKFYAKLPDEDLKAMLAYLKSLTPVANQVPAPVPPKS